MSELLLVAGLCFMVGASIGFLILAGMAITRKSLPPAVRSVTSTDHEKDMVDRIIERIAQQTQDGLR